MSPLPFPNATEAFHCGVTDIYQNGAITQSSLDPSSPGSHFGTKPRMMIEQLCYQFAISDPCARLVVMKGRKTNPIFAVANALWILSGRDDVDFIAYYNQIGKKFSDDGLTLYGAYGRRLFHGCRINQVAKVIERLKLDPSSRRAIAVVAQPRDASSNSRDVPCLMSVQFLFRLGRLDMVSHMRSQSACMVMPYDLFALMFLHEAVCMELNILPGVYRHVATSFHYYLDEEEIVRKVVNENMKMVQEDMSNTFPPRMDVQSSPFEDVVEVLKIADSIRLDGMLPKDIEGAKVSEYWKGILFLLGLQTWGKNDYALARIPEYYKSALDFSPHCT